MSGFFGPSCCQALKSAHRVAKRSFDHREGAMPGIAGKGRLNPTSRDQRTIKFGGLTAPPVAEPQAGTDGTGHGGVPCAARWISIRFSGSEVRHVDLSSASPTCANAPTLWHACPPMNRSKPRCVFVDHRTERAHGPARCGHGGRRSDRQTFPATRRRKASSSINALKLPGSAGLTK